MEDVSPASQAESIASYRSTIRKLEKALAQMTAKGANTTVVEKRLGAQRVGVAVLENVWQQQPHHYTMDDLASARDVLIGLLPSVTSLYEKSKPGTPQRTLLARRIAALDRAIRAIGEITGR